MNPLLLKLKKVNEADRNRMFLGGLGLAVGTYFYDSIILFWSNEKIE